ncbi:MAG: DUF58 domain-containing protein [Acidimicrobiia bacterium]
MIPPAPAPVRLTPRGRSLLLASGVLIVLARLFGSVELAGLGAAGGAAVAVAVVRLRSGAVSYSVKRRLESARVPHGGSARASLTFANRSGRRGRHVASVTDAVMGGSARCLVAPLAPDEVAEVTYDIPTDRRGVIGIGPLRLAVSDALGLAEVSETAGDEDRLIVHPRIEDVMALGGSGLPEGQRGARRRAGLPRGDDFYALRAYELGDDLRRVHWRSTAKADELMLRQEELRHDEVATVLLDGRAAVHDEASFERALEVAASLTYALVAEGRPVRFMTTGGFETEVADPARWTAVLDFLAAARPHPADRFAHAHEALRRRPAGPLAAITTAAATPELGRLGAPGGRLGPVIVALADCTADDDRDGSDSLPPVAGAVVVPVGGDAPFALAWNQAVTACRRLDPAPR